MKILVIACCMFILACKHTTSSASPDTAASASEGLAQYGIGPDRRSVQVSRNGKTITCHINGRVEQARPSFDRSALILSSSSYVSIEALSRCDANPISPNRVSAKSGMLVDINLSHRLYVALILVSTQPMSFLATVTNLDSDTNLVTLPGAYIEGSSLEEQQQQAFVYQGDDGSFAKISKDGRYVSADGDVDCSEDAYPGVWDVQKNTRVVLLGDDSETKCQDLLSH